MQTIFYLTTLAGLVMVLACGNLTGDDELPSQNQETENVDIPKLSEAFGHFIGNNLKSSGVDFNIDSIVLGIRNGMAGKPSPMTAQEYEKAMNLVQAKAQQELSTKNLDAANAFMKNNANETGIVELEPGKLQYLIIQEGHDPAVTKESKPSLHYTGKYLDGTVFGSSEQSGEPITLSLDQTIPGFGRGIEGMKEGEKRRLFIHPDLGYGTSGQLPPNSLLIFDIEVIKADTSDDAETDFETEE